MKPEMTHKERLLSTIERKPIDKYPVQFDFSPAALDKFLDYLNLPRQGISVTSDVPFENIAAMLKAAEEYRKIL